MSKNLLAVIDYQVDFVSGSLGFPGADRLDSLIADRIRRALEEGDDILFTFDTHYSNYLITREGKALPVEHAILNTPGHKLFGEVGRLYEEYAADPALASRIIAVNKTTFGMAPESINVFLRKKDYETIELCGLVSNMCVVSNACCLQATFPQAQIVIDATLTDSFDKRLHYQTLSVLQGMQVKILNRPLFAVISRGGNSNAPRSCIVVEYLDAIQIGAEYLTRFGGEAAIAEVPAKDYRIDLSLDWSYAEAHKVQILKLQF